jgi:hypothetical protein
MPDRMSGDPQPLERAATLPALADAVVKMGGSVTSRGLELGIGLENFPWSGSMRGGHPGP